MTKLTGQYFCLILDAYSQMYCSAILKHVCLLNKSGSLKYVDLMCSKYTQGSIRSTKELTNKIEK